MFVIRNVGSFVGSAVNFVAVDVVYLFVGVDSSGSGGAGKFPEASVVCFVFACAVLYCRSNPLLLHVPYSCKWGNLVPIHAVLH